MLLALDLALTLSRMEAISYSLYLYEFYLYFLTFTFYHLLYLANTNST